MLNGYSFRSIVAPLEFGFLCGIDICKESQHNYYEKKKRQPTMEL